MPRKKTKKIRIALTKKHLILGVGLLIIAIIGVWRLLFANASPGNCSALDSIQICDVDQIIKADGTDALLSVSSEAQSLGTQKWGTYFGAAFRAPTSAYKGAEPMYRLYAHSMTFHTVKFGPEANQTTSQTNVQTTNEGAQFFAWRNNPNLPGVVPIYRVTGTGWSFVDVFTSSGTIYNQLKGDTAAWQDGGVAFWAYDSGYTPPGQTNPYDCSKQENFTSERCAGARQEVINKINNDAKAASTNTNNKPPASTPTSLGSPQSASTPAPVPSSINCSDPNPNQATKDACLKQLANYIATQKTTGVTSTPTQTSINCSDPNPSQATKDACLKRWAEYANKNKAGSGGEKRDCSSPNPSDYEKYICTTLFLNAARQAAAQQAATQAAQENAARAAKNDGQSYIATGICWLKSDQNFIDPHSFTKAFPVNFGAPNDSSNYEGYWYVSRNDCVTFAQSLRKHLQEKHGIQDAYRVKSYWYSRNVQTLAQYRKNKGLWPYQPTNVSWYTNWYNE